ncbi:hypothetical protein VTO73DRAFT_3039 [Trametes versicolor]
MVPNGGGAHAALPSLDAPFFRRRVSRYTMCSAAQRAMHNYRPLEAADMGRLPAREPGPRRRHGAQPSSSDVMRASRGLPRRASRRMVRDARPPPACVPVPVGQQTAGALPL